MTIMLEQENANLQRSVLRPSRSSVRRRWIWIVAVGLLATAAYLYFFKDPRGSQQAGQKPTAPRPVPVVAVPAKKGDIGVYLTGLGSVVPLQTVTVRSRVDGQLMEVRFKEGQIVKAGELLAVIDPRPFAVQLTQAEGQLARDEALLANGRLDLQRYQELFAQDSIARQQLDTQASLVRQYEANVKTDRGLVESSRLNLVYTRITAPGGGRVGLRLVDPGNIVHATDTNGLVVITQMQPMTVIFTIAEESLSSVLDKMNGGARLEVDAYDRDWRRRIATGYLQTVDNQIDPTTGTVRLRALFQNSDSALFPNQFVNARLLLDLKRGATLVPAAAVQRGPQGSFVYLVTPDKKATVRTVQVGVTQGDEASIDRGLAPGEPVVTEGADRLQEGSPVTVQTTGGNAASGGRTGGQTGGQK